MQRAKNWTSRQVAMTAAYVNVLAGLSNIDRRGLIIFNTSGVDVLLNPNGPAADGTSPGADVVDAKSYTLPSGQTFDFADQPPIAALWAKGASGNILVWEA